MSDFCLSPQVMAHITRQTGLLDRMVARVAIVSYGPGRVADPGLWYEARLNCMDCALSRPCMRFLASPETEGRTPSFCPNRSLFAAVSKSAGQQLGIGRSK